MRSGLLSSRMATFTGQENESQLSDRHPGSCRVGFRVFMVGSGRELDLVFEVGSGSGCVGGLV